ncbi:putative mediator of RNA polymerase II transcription subunit 26 [Nematolebias whitei]|uniref:putative mediator of RNA polymerase II transcription subunit 26 n=1 Tax=Nematolebias whitei TaxID=451745 RepID=UPI001896CBAB|nr:putative mediator of RNA polymerase II transcription subunit 26 [Nematolebias whitei]
MDFFDDPNLFVGSLDELEEDGFSSAPSLVDELNLSADFEPLQMAALNPSKHQDMMSPASSQQGLPSYNQPVAQYIGAKAQNSMEQSFSGSHNTECGMIAEQHVQYNNITINQVPQANGLFCNNGSPMWGNQDQNGNVFHPLSQQQQQVCHQQLHNQQLHVRQHLQHHASHHQQEEQQQQHRMRLQQLQQRHNHPQQLLNQHQQIGTANVSLQQQQHRNFSFHQGGQASSHQQMHHTQQQVQHQLPARELQFHSRSIPSKSCLESQNSSRLQTEQQQGNYQLLRRGQSFSQSGLEDSHLSFPMHSPSVIHSLTTCSISSANAYQPAEYPAYPGEPEIPSLSQQSLSTASKCRPITTATHTSTVSGLSGATCRFQSTALMSQLHSRTTTTTNQTEQCPFRTLRCTGETQGNSSEMFGESVSCYPSIASQLLPQQPLSCGAINTNGYQAFRDDFLPSEAQDGDLEQLEPPDLLPDLLPQLEDDFTKQDKSSFSWVEASQKNGYEDRKLTSFECKDEKETCNQQ